MLNVEENCVRVWRKNLKIFPHFTCGVLVSFSYKHTHRRDSHTGLRHGSSSSTHSNRTWKWKIFHKNQHQRSVRFSYSNTENWKGARWLDSTMCKCVYQWGSTITIKAQIMCGSMLEKLFCSAQAHQNALHILFFYELCKSFATAW